MNINQNSFFKSAELLRAQGQYADAVSRYYYAVHYAALRWAKRNRQSPSQSDSSKTKWSHKNICSRVDGLLDINSKMSTLHNQRLQADYHREEDELFNEEECSTAKNSAIELLTELSR